MERPFLMPTIWAEPTIKQWLCDHPGAGPLDDKGLYEGAWLVVQYWKTSRAGDWHAELIGGKLSVN